MWPAAKAPRRVTCSDTGYRNIRVFDCALGATDGTTRLYLTMNRAKHSLIRRRDERDSADSIMVDVRTLDGVLAEAQQHAVDMIKIDVERAELAVFRGATATLRQNRNIVLLIDLYPAARSQAAGGIPLSQSEGFRLSRLSEPLPKGAVFIAYR